MQDLPLVEAARTIGVHPSVLSAAAQKGWIPSEWGTNVYNRPRRMFRMSDLTAYSSRQRERLTARLAKLEEAAA